MFLHNNSHFMLPVQPSVSILPQQSSTTFVYAFSCPCTAI